MNSVIMLENSDGTSGLDEKLKGSEGAAHVSQNGAVTAANGQTKVYVLQAHDSDDPQAGDNFISDAIGWKGFSVSVLTAIATNAPVLVAWSTTADVEGALETVLDTVNTAIITPDITPSSSDDVGVISINSDGAFVALWDGSERIRTIALLQGSNVVDSKCLVTVIS